MVKNFQAKSFALCLEIFFEFFKNFFSNRTQHTRVKRTHFMHIYVHRKKGSRK